MLLAGTETERRDDCYVHQIVEYYDHDELRNEIEHIILVVGFLRKPFDIHQLGFNVLAHIV